MREEKKYIERTFNTELGDECREALAELLNDYPCMVDLADELDTSSTAVGKWFKQGYVPIKYALIIHLKTKGKFSWQALCPYYKLMLIEKFDIKENELDLI